jgi:hypothetical protein
MTISTRHAHVSSESADCDGRYIRSHVVPMTAEEVEESTRDVNDFSEINFRERVLGSVVSLTTFRDGQEGSVTITEHGFTYSRPTDEGFESVDVTWCEDSDCDNASTYRDHSAERAGY